MDIYVMTDTLVAIDIAIEPDATMVQRSLADNAALLKNFPQGYTLDNTHHAHVSMLQRFVRNSDLDNVYAAIKPFPKGGSLPASSAIGSASLRPSPRISATSLR